ncbi:radical SAM protein [Desulfosporosinus sp. BICA1-9]|uniref:radical SAM protein n=1 Tax=Desulfosporosinus sp. BICA1-9 TaxID=1531958 RepID=UPI00054B6D98|nr:radical SAM protein [Desulfosporosinus sp. BICA1-9]KJS49429.1 MAG: radical SAM protein [Peptococcaceae bacterium BRH_c23]KJS77747.1 MAG: radical SAM protein [Desulfosporosinus sp. BICA1-9]HBW38044.1 radical SAM protein [Desulfosporosinus sp.]
MRYEGTVYRPPSEAESLLIQATIGCPHNKCTFCNMYRDKKFRIRSVTDIKEDLRMAQDYYGNKVQTIFFPDGNTILMKTDQLIEILNYARELFPFLKRMTVYGSAKFIKLKTLQELRLLKEAGLNRIHSGMESGDDEVLRRIQKGFTALEMIEAGLKVREAGIELSEYILIGIGGRERTYEHAIESARVLNKFTPDFVRLRTYVPYKRTPLYEELQQGSFQLLSPHEALRETRLLVANLEGPFELLSDHFSNFAWVNGTIPKDKAIILNSLDQLLEVPENEFRTRY